MTIVLVIVAFFVGVLAGAALIGLCMMGKDQ